MDQVFIDIEAEDPRNIFQPLFANIFNSTTRKKSASEEAIASLEKVDVSKLSDRTCSICYEEFEAPSGLGTTDEVPKSTSLGLKFDEVMQSDKAITDSLANYGLYREPISQTARFNDPSMFFPTDTGGALYSRFPQRNLSTFENVTNEDQFPGYKVKSHVDTKLDQYKKGGHIAVKMPECEHVFGLPCIIEWLKANVSCPLCRKEVEARNDNPEKTRKETIQQNTRTNFNDPSDMVEHIINHSTDIFNPFRRPFNPSITPITDSSMHQEWSTPHYQSRVFTRDPDLVMPRKIPFGDPFVSRRSTTFRTRTQNSATTNNNNNNNNSNNNINSNSDVNGTTNTDTNDSIDSLSEVIGE
ncbi:hypothetical protein SBY92_000717 [Candida maltosa Xu316]